VPFGFRPFSVVAVDFTWPTAFWTSLPISLKVEAISCGELGGGDSNASTSDTSVFSSFSSACTALCACFPSLVDGFPSFWSELSSCDVASSSPLFTCELASSSEPALFKPLNVESTDVPNVWMAEHTPLAHYLADELDDAA